MDTQPHTMAGALVTGLFLETFRLNGRLLASGDRLVADLGLTSARWQVLGAIALADRPGPVAHLARFMGLSRQAVQRIVNDLAARDLVTFAPNPHHARAKLVLLTDKGQDIYERAHRIQVPWSNGLGEGLDPAALQNALAVVRALRESLETEAASDVEEHA